MMKPASLTLVAALGISSWMTPQESSLADRVHELEQWKQTAETRISNLESAVQGRKRDPAPAPADSTEAILTVAIIGKRFKAANPRAGTYQDSIWWDAEYTANQLEKPARSIKGVLEFCDLFGDPQFQVRVTLDDPIEPNGTITQEGVGINYNQFLEDHRWLRTTALDDMSFRFEVRSVLYEDGTVGRFGQ